MKFKLFGWTVIIEKDGFDHKYAEKMILHVSKQAAQIIRSPKIMAIKWVRDYAASIGQAMALKAAKEYVEAVWIEHDISYESLKQCVDNKS